MRTRQTFSLHRAVIDLRRSLVPWAFACAVCLNHSALSHAQDGPHPLQPADTSSPRATLTSFIENMNSAFELLRTDTSAATVARAAIYKTRAVRCLDLSMIDPTVVADLGEKRAVMLSEILDRIDLPARDTVPDANAAQELKPARWRIPNTEITIVRVAEGPRAGEFLFSPDTVSRIPEFFDRVRHLPYRTGPVMEGAYDKLFTQASPSPSAVSPLKPADTSSPQATLRTFVDEMNAVYRSFKADGMRPDAIARRQEFTSRAIRTLNLETVPPSVVDEVGKETAVLLMETLDRIALPVIEQVPGTKQVEKAHLTTWTIPNTAITITRVQEGPRANEFLFSPDTVNRAKEFYDRVAHLPYREAAVLENAYYVYLQAPGPMIPIAWIMGMPASLKQIQFGLPVWKWIALAIVMALFLGGLVLALRLGFRKRNGDAQVSSLKRVMVPISGIVLSILALQALDQINPGKDIVYLASILLTVVTAVAQLWLVIVVVNAVAESIVASPRINPRSIDAQLVRVCFRLVSVGAFVFVVVRTAHNIGIPLTPVLAGLGVGGIAVALAAQNSLENLIGGFNLFTDRPVRVGDFCRFGQRVGIVEEIGLRSTRVRSLDDTVVSIPNSTFSKMELENFTKRTKFLYRPRLQLVKNATPDQVRFVLIEVRRMLYSHPKVDPKPARIRFVEFGTSSLDLDVFAYVLAADYDEFLGVAEDLHLRIMDIVAKAGTSLAVPAQRTLLERPPDRGHDLVQQTEAQVQEWRDHNQLYLPQFPANVVAQLRDGITFPPKGAPPAGPSA